VCHTLGGLAIYIKKNYGNSNISPCKNIIFKKNKIPLNKETKNPSRDYNSIITKSQVSTQAKISSF
jgi:hypothetical protein